MRRVTHLLPVAALATLTLGVAPVTVVAAVSGKDKNPWNDRRAPQPAPPAPAPAPAPALPAAPAAPATPAGPAAPAAPAAATPGAPAAPAAPSAPAAPTSSLPAWLSKLMTAVKTAVGQQSAKGGQTAPATPAPAPSGGAAPVASVPGVGDVPPAATPIAPVSAPVLGQTMAVAPAHGNVQIRLPGSSAYVPLGAAGSIPSGAIVDARSGTIVLSTAIDASGATQTAKLWGAVFQVRQSAAGKGMTDLVVRDRPQGCRGAAPAARAASVTPRRKRSTAGLWAQDSHGRFRSRGRNSVATVRGTRWLTRETCAGTLTQVTEGAVAVRDLRRHRTVTVRAGGRYLAKTAG